MYELKRSNLLVQHRRYDAWDGFAYEKPPPLGVKLTGYRLLNVGVILVFGVTKAALAYCGHSLALTTLNWAAGALIAIILYWVGQLKTRSDCHPRWLLFFHVDWAPEILEAIKTVKVPFAPLEYVSFFNKLNGLNCYAQDCKPVGLEVCNWSLDVPVDLLRRHSHRHYLSALTIALIYITLLCFETSFLFVVP
ncbi:hypothetical protein V8E53_003853 [Lactarius tabidus]